MHYFGLVCLEQQYRWFFCVCDTSILLTLVIRKQCGCVIADSAVARANIGVSHARANIGVSHMRVNIGVSHARANIGVSHARANIGVSHAHTNTLFMF